MAARLRTFTPADYPRLIAMQVQYKVPEPPTLLAIFKEALARDSSWWEPEAITIAVDGDQWAGMAWLQKRPSGAYYHTMTAVSRAYRGRHLTTALKLTAINYARSKGAPYIRTNNESGNERILAVNRKLGYQPLPGFFALECKLAY